MIHVINISKEDYSFSDNYYYIGRPSILENPYTHLPLKNTRALYQCKSREESISKYNDYFDTMYGHNIEYTKLIDEIYEKYKNGEEIYLGCWCHPLSCHGDIIKQKLEQKLIKEKIKNLKRKKT